MNRKHPLIQVLLIALFVLFLVMPCLSAQETTDAKVDDSVANANSVETPMSEDGIMSPGELEKATRQLDISTASHADLIDMCSNAGLDITGSPDVLRKRIANFYNVTVLDRKTTQPTTSGSNNKKSGPRYITIESANSTRYITATEDRELISLSGDVVISIKDESDTCKISASIVTYDKINDKIHARGNIKFERKSNQSDSSDIFTGAAFMFDIADMKGVFLDGTTTHDPGKSNADPYIVAAHSIGSNEDSTMAFNHATMTTCDNPNPHWKIRASRIWILPGNEFAVLNGVMFIGSIPVFYFPFLYYPSDEMIFHPAFGTRTREGKFVQTSTYLIGRKRAEKSTENTLANFFQSDTDMVQERHGLFFKNTEKKEKSTDTTYLKVLFDAYTKLGVMAAVDASLKPSKNISELKLFAGVAKSRTIFDGHTFDSNGESEWNDSNFLGFDMPFRYKFNLSTKMSFPNFSLDVALPILSDPYFNNDFIENRSETLNWLANFMSSDEEDETVTTTASLLWSVGGSAKIPMTVCKPFIESLQVTSFKSSVTLYNKSDDSVGAYSPLRQFYYPSQITPLNINLSMSGTIFSTVVAAQTEMSENSNEKTVPPQLAISLQSPFEEPESKENKTTPQEKKDSAEDSSALSYDTFVSEIKSSSSGISSVLPSFKVTYLLVPTFSSEILYDPAKWTSADVVDWTDVKSTYYAANGAFTLSADFSYPSYVTSSTSFTGYVGWQEHPYLSDESYTTDASKNSVLLSDYKAQKYYVQAKESLSVKPLAWTSRMAQSSLGWNFTGNILRSVYTGFENTSLPDLEPEWKNQVMEWDTDSIETHSASAVVSYRFFDYDQKMSVIANLPPQVGSVQLSSGFGHSRLNVSVSTKYYQKSKDDDEWLWNSLTTVMTWTIITDLSLTQTLIYDIEEDLTSSYDVSLKWKKLTASFKMTSSVPYTFDSGSWVAGTEKEFQPSSVSISYNDTAKPQYFWKNRITLTAGGSASLLLNLLKVTESSFTFIPSITFKLYKSTDFTFSSVSTNTVIARYFKGIDAFGLPSDMVGETNPFLDLIHSFYFWDTEMRRQSGFKLKSLNFSLTQQLHDWTVTATLKVVPELKDRSYEYEPEFSLIVAWKPVSDLKAEISYKDDIFKLNP